uniref:Uncharacterized protein n=1 Tax=Oryza sativa subsp. japonica TaxID=39947 RepID=Q6K6L1_ORYSJ|nr:hypothetical protein [Oryza sativa Japonica Group]
MHGQRSAVGGGACARGGGRVTVVDWGSGAATTVALRAVVPAARGVGENGGGEHRGGPYMLGREVGRWATTASPARVDEAGRREDNGVVGSDMRMRGGHGGCRSEEKESPDRADDDEIVDGEHEGCDCGECEGTDSIDVEEKAERLGMKLNLTRRWVHDARRIRPRLKEFISDQTYTCGSSRIDEARICVALKREDQYREDLTTTGRLKLWKTHLGRGVLQLVFDRRQQHQGLCGSEELAKRRRIVSRLECHVHVDLNLMIGAKRWFGGVAHRHKTGGMVQLCGDQGDVKKDKKVLQMDSLQV